MQIGFRPAQSFDRPDVAMPMHNVVPRKRNMERCKPFFVVPICKNPAPPANSQARHLSGSDSRFGLGEDGREPPGLALSPTLAASLTEEDVRALASDDVALWLDASRDWRDAIPHVLRELGANVSAWHDACDVMGETVAFLALLVIDRNRFHPDRPILNPGGTLRAFTARARTGELDLTRSVLGILERERQRRQPKGPSAPQRPSLASTTGKRPKRPFLLRHNWIVLFRQ